MAAVAVMYSHSYILLGDHEPSIRVFSKIDPAYLAVNFFFFLSGYLMYSALLRSKSQIGFMINRFSRIIPGLVVCVGLTLILGFMVTSYSARDYFGSIGFFKYFRNAVFLFTPGLPGVFENNPYPVVVNGSLWTLLYEVACYGALGFLIVFSQKTRSLILSLLTVLCVAHLTFFEYVGPTFWSNLSRLSLLFCAGYLFGEVHKRKYYYAAVVIVLLIYSLIAHRLQPIAGGLLFSVLFCSILLDVALRLDRFFPSLPFDSSYGIYIYAFPIQQYLVYLNLELSAHQLFIYSFLLVFPIATISWFYVENPGMKKIRDFKKFLK